MSSSTVTVVSAPGKVLIIGGYLILDRSYQGLTIGTDARFYTIVKPGNKCSKITVHSPQFNDAAWEYRVNDACQVEAINEDNRNSFVEITVKYTLSVIANRIPKQKFNEIINQGLDIYIAGSNDFYSQRKQLEILKLPLNTSSLRLLTPFNKNDINLKQVHKTGLGSSAALITSLVAALLIHFQCIDNIGNQQKTLIHNVAQMCHCLAQGKIGSGFDVSAAVWGSHVYKRFSPDILNPVIQDENNVDGATIDNIVDPSTSNWDNEVVPTALPPRFTLVIADVDIGSNTPKLVGKVLAWRKANPEQAKALWDTLASHNSMVIDGLRELRSEYENNKSEYEKAIELCSEVKGSEWATLAEQKTLHSNIINGLIKIFQSFQKVRQFLREMSTLSGAPIEPPVQTKLLDACTEIPGVIMAGVPGAGGFDAIFCIGIGNKFVENVENLWLNWKEMNVGPLLANESSEGLKIENLDSVKGLATILT
ncbi:3964_t:CDS:2 [Acaulospora morrowiae]|uniref:Phosphomevalonate kinase n=1 Tax=Acaulospora morrowiae TaxID=94023 RepID=A0A9N9DXS5_9GLOM|nr:3964_t:CDS:2 [Acaulospora morrowiae]